METLTENTALVRVLETSGVEKTKAESVMEFFTPFFEQASEWESKVKALIITDASQVREMRMAREGRLALKDIRVNADKTRKKLKEASLREGNFIQSVYNIIEGVISPLETELLEKEKFAENLEKERLAKLKADRADQLFPFVENVEHYWLEGMSDNEFNNLLSDSKLAHEAKIEAERKAEQDRIAKEKAEAEERERIRIENDRLRKEAEAREKAMEAERKAAAEKLEAERREAAERQRIADEKARKEREAIEAENRKKQAEADAKLKAEREAREKLEAEKRAIEAKAEKERKEREAAEKKAKNAPDKQKLAAYAETLRMLPVPELVSDEAKSIIKEADVFLLTAIDFINESIKTL